MIYLYTLPGINFNYPDIKNILYSTYLRQNKIKYKYFDYTDYLLNNIFINKNFSEDIDTIKENIKNSNMDLLKANNSFIKAINNYLDKFGIIYTGRGFNYKYRITNISDFLKVGEKIEDFIDLFVIDQYNDGDIIFMNVSYGFQVPIAIALSKRIKKCNNNTRIIWGGNYITQINENCNELINKVKYLDAIIIFDYIKTFKDLIAYYQEGKLELINIIRKDQPFIIRNNLVDDKNYYYLDYSDIDLSHYLSRDRILPIFLTYGCYYHKCNFCSHHYHFGGYLSINRKKMYENIFKMYKKNSFDSIILIDECVPPNILLEFAEFLLNKKIHTKWMVETRIKEEYLDKRNVFKLADSGCKFISFGIESYNKRILKLMNKGIDIKSIKKVLRNFFNSNIIVSSTFMIGYPKENIFNIYKTLNFIKKFKYIDVFGLNIFVLSRNSILYNELGFNSNNINLIYRFKNSRRNKIEKILNTFNNNSKIKKFNNIKNNLLNRCDYFYLERKNFSLNYKEVIK